MPVLNQEESRRLDRIERGIQYGATFKDLAWLVRLARRLEKKCEASSSRQTFLPLTYSAPPVIPRTTPPVTRPTPRTAHHPRPQAAR